MITYDTNRAPSPTTMGGWVKQLAVNTGIGLLAAGASRLVTRDPLVGVLVTITGLVAGAVRPSFEVKFNKSEWIKARDLKVGLFGSVLVGATVAYPITRFLGTQILATASRVTSSVSSRSLFSRRVAIPVGLGLMFCISRLAGPHNRSGSDTDTDTDVD